MTRTNIFAYTPLSPHYPEYLSLYARDDGSFEVIVRDGPVTDGPHPRYGPTAHIVLPRAELFELIAAATTYLARNA